MIPIAKLIAAMLLVATPGVQPLSRVDLNPCGATCVEIERDYSGFDVTVDFVALGGRVRWPGLSRQETREEALDRWVTIATAIADVAPDQWTALFLVALARAESAYWRPVHEGRMRGSAGEWGLWQCHPRIAGCDESLVGLDRDATTRAARFAAGQVAAARRYVVARCPEEDRAAAVFRVYGSGNGCSGAVPILERRVGWFETVRGARGGPFERALMLGLESGTVAGWAPESAL